MNWESIDEVIHECMKAQLLVHEDWEDYLTFKRKMYHMKNTKMRDVLNILAALITMHVTPSETPSWQSTSDSPVKRSGTCWNITAWKT
ncbi:MAG: hypothetical protein LUE27_07740 [Clostridia bacterium]|nr:hypothetical protein [Clostridia bacterium]